MTDRRPPGHSGAMAAALADVHWLLGRAETQEETRTDPRPDAGAAVHAFDEVYDAWFDFVWRSVRRLGVADDAVDDCVQDVFVVVHRKLGAFEGRSSLKTWLFGIALRVARDYRRAARRRSIVPLPESLSDGSGSSPMERCAKREAVALLHALLDELDDEKRAVFVMAELEQMSAPEIAEAVGANVNTIYSRLRAARAEFEQAVARHRARERWRQGA